MKNRKCLISDCNDRHREDCKFQKQGCTRSTSCAFLHKTKEIRVETAGENNNTNTEELNNIKQLEVIIKDMKKELQNKDENIMIKIKEINDLKIEVQQRYA